MHKHHLIIRFIYNGERTWLQHIYGFIIFICHGFISCEKKRRGQGRQEGNRALINTTQSLFSVEFEEFIENLRQVTAYLDANGEKFSSILES